MYVEAHSLDIDLSHLIMVGLFVSGDLPLQVLDVALQGADQPQQPLPLLLQRVDVCAPVVDLPLQTVELAAQRVGVQMRDRRR